MLDMYDIWHYPVQGWWRMINEMLNCLLQKR